MDEHVDVVLRAAWVCPVATTPFPNGYVGIKDGRIHCVGAASAQPDADHAYYLENTVLLPGLINAHTHLELSWMRGRVPPGADFLTWVGGLMGQRRGLEQPGDPATDEPIRAAIAELRATGTVAVGDIANALVSPGLLAEAGMDAVVFHELIGFRVTDGARLVAEARTRHAALGSNRVRMALAPHAPFSVSRELFTAIRDAAAASTPPLISVHAGESPQEVELLRTGGGPWQERLVALGAWRDGWTAPGCGPGDYLCDLGVIGADTLVVHGVQLSDAELARIRACGATLVTCPRSNAWVGVGEPPIERFLASGVKLALGTDSLASCPDLNLFSELAELRRLAPHAPARQLLATATQAGAAALGLGDLGVILPDRRAIFVAVDVPPGTTDPEEALLHGVDPERIRLLDLSRYDGAPG